MKRIIATSDTQTLYTDEPIEAGISDSTLAYVEGHKPQPLASFLKFQPNYWRPAGLPEGL